MLDNQNGSTSSSIGTTTNSINSSNNSLNGFASVDQHSPTSIRNRLNKRNSIGSTLSFQNEAIGKTLNQSISEQPPEKSPEEKEELGASLAHRRSLSEHVMTSPTHTIPADKARRHILNRNNSQLQEEMTIDLIPTYSNVTLKKVAETMFLKDPQYKPRPKDDSKTNPFAALARLRGVKKIIGANATTYTPGAGDLFSSCFEISSPFLKNLNDFNYKRNQLTCDHNPQPKSLPNSPLSTRKEFAIERLTGSVYENPQDTSKCGKKCFDKLQNHPLYQSAKHEVGESKLELAVPTITTTTIAASASHSYSKLVNKIEPVTMDSPTVGAVGFYETPRLLTRRGSTESGFFSCLNEDFLDRTRDVDLLMNCCSCCPTPSNPVSGKKDDTSNDSSSISLRSLDDLELSEALQNRRTFCPHRHIDIDARSIDMGLINRLTLDTEINTLIQKHQLSNQLFHCKNRTSSIYSDSSDSLAGSDSLLWDDRSYPIPNTRSAQIAKIVEYFERKGANFKTPTFAVPEIKPSTSFVASPARSYLPTSNYHHHKQLTDYFVDLRRDFNDITNSKVTPTSASFVGLAGGYKSQRDYETFCLELADKKSPQNFHKICEGLVKSKLQLFDDKLKQNNQPEK